MVTSTGVFMTAVCWVGSKSLSHVLACIDRTKGRLIDAGTATPAARSQIIASVMEYWQAHPGAALSITEKLLNYSILTPLSIVDWALVANTPPSGTDGGKALGQPHMFELVSNTVAKVSGRVRQILTALDAETDGETRDAEVAAMRDLFRGINDALTSWAGGSKDQAMEQGDGTSEQEAMIRRWGQRWLRVFRRLAAVEETFVAEAIGGRWAAKDKMDTAE